MYTGNAPLGATKERSNPMQFPATTCEGPLYMLVTS